MLGKYVAQDIGAAKAFHKQSTSVSERKQKVSTPFIGTTL